MLKSICIEKGLPHATTSDLQKEAVIALSRDRMLGIGLTLGADRSRYGTMVRSFENAYTTGRDEWPKTLVAAYLDTADDLGGAFAPRAVNIVCTGKPVGIS